MLEPTPSDPSPAVGPGQDDADHGDTSQRIFIGREGADEAPIVVPGGLPEEVLETVDRNFDMLIHEIRNPLSSIMQMAENILYSLRSSKETGEVDIDGMIEMARRIQLCVQHQKRVLDNRLTSRAIIAQHIGRDSAKKADSVVANMMLNLDPFQPLQLARDCVKMFVSDEMTRVKEKGGATTKASVPKMRVVVTNSYLQHGVDTVLVDSVKLSQILTNLLGNASKFTIGREKMNITLRIGASKTLPVADGNVTFLTEEERNSGEEGDISDETGSISASSPPKPLDIKPTLSLARAARIQSLKSRVDQANADMEQFYKDQEQTAEKDGAGNDGDSDNGSIYADARSRIHSTTQTPIIEAPGFCYNISSDDTKPPKLVLSTVEEKAITIDNDSEDVADNSDEEDAYSITSSNCDAQSILYPEDFMRQGSENQPGDIKEEELYLLFAVRDTGIGIAPDKLKHLFKRYSQVSGDKRYEGSGLGLYLSRDLARLHGGDLGVYSKCNVGSTFAFYIKVKTCARPGCSLAPSQPLSKCLTRNFHTPRDSTDSGFPTSQLAVSNRRGCGNMFGHDNSPISGASFLIVDDNETCTKILAQNLRKFHCQVHVVNDGKEAIDFLKKSRLAVDAPPDAPAVDVVCMDSNMPNMNGMEATREIRRLERIGELIGHVIIIGTLGDNFKRDAMKAVGMDDTLIKPHTGGDVINMASTLLKRKSISVWTDMNTQDSSLNQSLTTSIAPATTSNSSGSSRTSRLSSMCTDDEHPSSEHGDLPDEPETSDTSDTGESEVNARGEDSKATGV